MKFIRATTIAFMMALAGCGSKADEAATTTGADSATPVNVADASPPPVIAEEDSSLAPVESDIVVADAGEAAKPAIWTVDKANSRIEFTGSQTGKDFTGSFSTFDAAITFDPAELSSAHIKVAIDMASAATGDRQRDDALPSPDWFSVKEFPSALFEATDVRVAGAGYEARGRLTIRGVSKDLTLPFSLTIAGDRATADGVATLVRTDFGVGQGEFATGEWVGLDVKVALHIEAVR